MRPGLVALTGALMLGAATPAAAQWKRLDSPNLVVLGDGNERSLRDVAAELEGFREVVSRVLGPRVTAAPVPTIVVVFPSETAMAPFRPKYYGRPVDVAGVFVPGRDVNYIALIDDGKPGRLRTIFHEYTHLLISHPDQPLPLWLNEGLAEYYSTFELQGGARDAVIGTVIDDHLATLNHAVLIRIEDLIKIDQETPLYNEGSRRSVFYAEAWALTHLIFLGDPPRVNELNSYLDNLSAGDEPIQAWQKAFGAVNMQKTVEDYVRQRLFRAQKPTFSGAVTNFESRTVMLKPSEVQTYLADLQIQLGDLDAAALRIEQAKKLDAASPAVPIESARLARARVADAGGTSDVHLDDLATPGDWLLAYLAGVSEAGATIDGNRVPSAQDVATVRRLLTAAAAGHPMFLNAAGRLAEVELRSSEGPSAATTAALAAAREQAPQRYQYAFLHAQVLARQAQYAQARAAIEPFIAGPYPSAVRKSARSFMGYIVDAETARARGLSAPPAPTLPGDLTGTQTEESYTLRPDFRKLQPGEQRLEGALTSIECVQGKGITFHVKSGDQDVTTTAPNFDGVDLITYRDDLKGNVPCGPMAVPMPVYLTWKAGANGAKIAVAIEFLPKLGSSERLCESLVQLPHALSQ